MTFIPEQIKMLEEKLDSKNVSQRKQSGISLSYLEGYHVIDEANRIFGYDGWSYNVDILEKATEEITIGAKRTPGHKVGVIAKVYVSVGGSFREDVGFGGGRSSSLIDAHELAYKEAVTDALKRALRSFGNQFGNALYDKDQKNVEDKEEVAPKKQSKPSQEPKKTTGNQDFKAMIDGLSTLEECDNFRKEYKDDISKLSNADEIKKYFINHKKGLK